MKMHWIFEDLLQPIDFYILFFWVVFRAKAYCATKSLKHNCDSCLFHLRVLLTSVIRAIINKSFQENFNIIFVENRKSCQNINLFFPFLRNFCLKSLQKTGAIAVFLIYGYKPKTANIGPSRLFWQFFSRCSLMLPNEYDNRFG